MYRNFTEYIVNFLYSDGLLVIVLFFHVHHDQIPLFAAAYLECCSLGPQFFSLNQNQNEYLVEFVECNFFKLLQANTHLDLSALILWQSFIQLKRFVQWKRAHSYVCLKVVSFLRNDSSKWWHVHMKYMKSFRVSIAWLRWSIRNSVCLTRSAYRYFWIFHAICFIRLLFLPPPPHIHLALVFILFFSCVRSQRSYHVDDCPTAIPISYNWIRGYRCYTMGHENLIYEVEN